MTNEQSPDITPENELQTVMDEYAITHSVSALDVIMIQHRINMLAAAAPQEHEVNVRQVVEHYFNEH